MKNVTIKLDEETARWIRIQAANHDTSVSRLVGEILRERRLQDAKYQTSMAQFLGREAQELKTGDATYPDRDSLYDRTVLR